MDAVASLCESGPVEPVAKIAARVTGSKPSPGTVWRWCRKGLRGGRIKLAAVFHAGQWRTSEVAFREFLTEQTDAQLSDPPSRFAHLDDSDAALEAAGLL